MDSLKIIEQEVYDCRKCRLYKNTNHGVPGEGPKNAKIFFIGQAPGAQEDKTGHPFVGRSGKYLTKQLEESGIHRDKVFITGVAKHYPPRNRAPKKDEIAACKPFLLRQLAIIKPKIVVLMGKTAETIKNESILKNKAVITTVHPSAAMRFPKMAAKMKRDFQRLKQLTKKLL
jgi:DNA polymerase